MPSTSYLHKPFGKTGLFYPPITFRAGVADIADSIARIQCGEWFQRVAPPIAIELPYDDNNLEPIRQLGRALRHFEVRGDELIANLIVPGALLDQFANVGTLHHLIDDANRALGGHLAIQLVTLDTEGVAENASHTATSALRALHTIKKSGRVAGIGIRTAPSATAQEVAHQAQIDFLHLAGLWTVMHHAPAEVELLKYCREQQIPVVCSGVLQHGFLVGRGQPQEPANSAGNVPEESLHAWRKAFTSLCHGHGVRPAHACIQFALRAPAVASVSLATSNVDRVAENVADAMTPVPDALWSSLKEEGLLGDIAS